MEEQEITPRNVPKEIEERVAAWYRMFNFASRSHYVVGVLGVACSALAAADIFDISQFLAALSAVCIAILGFAQPERKYMKFARAWRVLDAAALKYKYRKIDLETLLDTVDRGEQMLTDFEQEVLKKTSQTTEKALP
jgi:hypothetical protein